MTDHRTVATGVSEAAVEQRAGAPARLGSKWWTLVAVCPGMFMSLLDITIVMVALPESQRGLGSSFAGLQWIVDAYALTLAASLLTAGSLSDMYGRRRLFLIGLVVFTGASLLCGFATSTLMLQVSRAVQGVGGGGPLFVLTAAGTGGTSLFHVFGYAGLFLSLVLILRVIIAITRDGI